MYGITYKREAISQELQADYLKYVGDMDVFWRRDTSLTLSYGFQYMRDWKSIDSKHATIPIPDAFDTLLNGLDSMYNLRPNQLSIVNLEPIDALPHKRESLISVGDEICIFTLYSPVLLTLKAVDKQELRLLLETGSLTILSGSSRFEYEYGIDSNPSIAWQNKIIVRDQTVLLIFRHILDDFVQVDDELYNEMRIKGGKFGTTE